MRLVTISTASGRLMPSDQGIADSIELLVAAGCSMPKATSVAAIGVAWSVVMPDVDDDRLMAACLLYLRGPQAAWWPKPGQLLELLRGGQDDTSGEDWGRLRGLRRQHGATEPAAIDAPRTFELSPSRAEAQARWCGIEDCGGWSRFAAGARLDVFVSGYRRAIEGARRLLEGSTRWSDKVKREVADWHRQADASAAYQELRGIADRCGAMVPRDPRKPKPFRLHDDPRRERAMSAGLAAAGGWREVWPDGSTIPENLRASDAANRRAFVSAYRAAMQRTERRSEAHKVAALVDMTSQALALPVHDREQL